MNESHTILPLRGYNRYEVQGLLNFIYSKDTSKDALLDHGVKRLLNELKVNGFYKKETNPTVEKSYQNINEIKKEFEILNSSNIAIDTIAPAEPESNGVPEMSLSRKEDIKSLSLQTKSLTVIRIEDTVTPYGPESNDMSEMNFKRIEEKAKSDTEAIIKINLNELSDNPDIESTIIFEGQEVPIIDEFNYSFEEANVQENGVEERNTNDDEMIEVISNTKPTYECNLCDLTFNIKILLKRHERSNHENEKPICKVCKKKLLNKRRLKVHFDLLHKEQRYKCKKCDYKSGEKRFIRNHFSLCHKDARFACDMCNKCCKTRSQLKVHKLIHTEAHERRLFSCDKCNQSYPSKPNLYAHKKTVHDRVRYPCVLCPFQASSKQYLKKHEEGFHLGKTYDCTYCDYKGKVELSLKKHIRVNHEGLRFYCDECPEQYRSKGQLQKHKETKHKQEKSKRSHNKANFYWLKNDVTLNGHLGSHLPEC